MQGSGIFNKPLYNFVKKYSFVDRYMTKYITEDDVYYYHHTNNLVIIGISN